MLKIIISDYATNIFYYQKFIVLYVTITLLFINRFSKFKVERVRPCVLNSLFLVRSLQEINEGGR